ncbi:unnamed protein product, partial [Choristocarpus tenellus]
MYIPFRSSHPMHSKRGYITGELLRYVSTCSDKESYPEVRNKFYFKLRARGYPPWFLLLQCFEKVNYSQRAERLKPTIPRQDITPATFVLSYHPMWDIPSIK